jgi:hypothetical protein
MNQLRLLIDFKLRLTSLPSFKFSNLAIMVRSSEIILIKMGIEELPSRNGRHYS